MNLGNAKTYNLDSESIKTDKMNIENATFKIVNDTVDVSSDISSNKFIGKLESNSALAKSLFTTFVNSSQIIYHHLILLKKDFLFMLQVIINILV